MRAEYPQKWVLQPYNLGNEIYTKDDQDQTGGTLFDFCFFFAFKIEGDATNKRRTTTEPSNPKLRSTI